MSLPRPVPVCSSRDVEKNLFDQSRDEGYEVVCEGGELYEYHGRSCTFAGFVAGPSLSAAQLRFMNLVSQYRRNLAADGDVELNPGPRSGVEDTHVNRSTRREVERRAGCHNLAASRRAQRIVAQVAKPAGHAATCAEQRKQYTRSGGEENPGPGLLVRGCSALCWIMFGWVVFALCISTSPFALCRVFMTISRPMSCVCATYHTTA